MDNYFTFQDSDDLDSRAMIMDITDAIKRAPLSPREKLVLGKLYFSSPKAPERDRLDKNGFTNGRPPGGVTTTTVAQDLRMDFRRVSEIKQAAILKITETLGADYGL